MQLSKVIPAFGLPLLFLSASQAIEVPVVSYNFVVSPTGPFYIDSGGELTDGITDTVVWDGTNSPTMAHIEPLVGWQFATPSIVFDFGSVYNVNEVTLWFADSDGHAGVSMPSSVTLSSGAFSQSFTITDPAGAGVMVPVVLSGFSVETSSLSVVAQAGTALNWTMLSEAKFSAIPEASSSGALFAGVAIGFALTRRRKKSR